MRSKVHEQLGLVEPIMAHEHAQELAEISLLLADHPEIADLIYEDLIEGLKDPIKGRRGRLSAEQVFKILVIKQMNGYSYDMLAYHLADSRSYRTFCGLEFFKETPSASSLQRDIKKIRANSLEKIQRCLLQDKVVLEVEDGKKTRTDCTVVESNIHYPTDSSLLVDSVRVLSRLTQQAKKQFEVIATNHYRRAKRRGLGIINAKREKDRKRYYRDLLKVSQKTVSNAICVLKTLQTTHSDDAVAISISDKLKHFIELALRVIDQTKRRVIDGEKVPANEKIVSIFETHTDIIVKKRRETVYGHKIVLTGGASGLLTDVVIESGNPSDSDLAIKMIERHKNIYNKLPKQTCFDGGFASKTNLKKIKKLEVDDVCFAKKRGLKISDMTKSTWVYKRLRDFRAGIEGMISFLKRSFGLRRCTWRGFNSFKTYTWASVLTANLLLIARRRLAT